jgi:hypothetical protein
MSEMQSCKFAVSEMNLALLFGELDHRIRHLFQRVIQAWDCGQERPDNRQPLRSEYFPLDARNREIVTRDGFIKFRDRRRIAKARQQRAFLPFEGRRLGHRDCLADLGGFELRHSHSAKAL